MSNEDFKRMRILLSRCNIEYEDMCNYAADVCEKAVDDSSEVFDDSMKEIFDILYKNQYA